jgi:hypothetical protein
MYFVKNDFELKQKIDNRGQRMVIAWQEAKKAGGIAYTPQQIDSILEERDDIVLTREEVKERISAYFQSCMTIAEDENTHELGYVWKKNPTKSGLALILGVRPETLIDYVKGHDRHGYVYKTDNQKENVQKINTNDFDLIRKAYVLIEDFYEQKLGDNRNNAGVIFWLNNRENSRWSNEQEFKFGTLENREDKHILTAAELPKLDMHASQLPTFEDNEECE